MNRIKVELIIETYSDSPEEWIADMVVDALESDENLISIQSTTDQ